jgi:long-subunit acyl-CoA synthetase (AMP-forming)
LLHQLSHSAVSLIFVSPTLIPTLQETLRLGKAKGFSVDQSRVVLLCTKEAKAADPSVKDVGYRCIEEVWSDKEWVHDGLTEGEEGETCLMCYSSGTVSPNRPVNVRVIIE